MKSRADFWRDVAVAGALILSVPGVAFLLVAAAVAVVLLAPTIAIALALDDGES
jgi:hypothetical protein